MQLVVTEAGQELSHNTVSVHAGIRSAAGMTDLMSLSWSATSTTSNYPGRAFGGRAGEELPVGHQRAPSAAKNTAPTSAGSAEPGPRTRTQPYAGAKVSQKPLVPPKPSKVRPAVEVRPLVAVGAAVLEAVVVAVLAEAEEITE